MEKVDPRWLAGIGTAMAGAALFGFSRLPYDDSLASLSVSASYASDILPFIILMSLGMGMTFVPITLTAVHGVGARDSGIGSGVLNTMQQVGGALGLATLSTVAVHFTSDKVASLSGSGPVRGWLRRPRPGGEDADPDRAGGVHRGRDARVPRRRGMIWLGTVIVLLFLNARHEDLATDEVPEGVGV